MSKIFSDDCLLIHVPLQPWRSWQREDVSQLPHSLCMSSTPHSLSEDWHCTPASQMRTRRGTVVAQLARWGAQGRPGWLNIRTRLLNTMLSQHPGPCPEVISHLGSSDLAGLPVGVGWGPSSILDVDCGFWGLPRDREAGLAGAAGGVGRIPRQPLS